MTASGRFYPARPAKASPLSILVSVYRSSYANATVGAR